MTGDPMREVLDALAAIPDAGDVAGYRATALLRPGAFGRSLRLVERQHALGMLTAAGVAEMWAWCAYLEHVRGYRATTTVATYLQAVSRLQAWARQQRLDYARLTASQLDGWQKWLAMAMAHSTHFRAKQVYAVRSFFAWRESRGIGPNVASGLRSPREPKHMPRKYTLQHLQGMCQAAAGGGTLRQQLRDVAMLLFLLATGARREEIANVSPADLHIGKRTGLVRFHGKGAKEREVPFEGPVVDALVAWMHERENIPNADPDALFVAIGQRLGDARIGRKLEAQAIERMVGKHAKTAGLKDYGVHRFRVTFATTMYDDGAGIEEIRILMGHESIETTRRYLSVSERLRRTRLRADRQHEVLGTRNKGQPRWINAALGGGGA